MTGDEVTVITATIPGREQFLARCLASVYGQTLPPRRHLVCAQLKVPSGPRQPAVSAAYNSLLPAVDTEWVFRLDDDNYLLPLGIETSIEAGRDVDMVFGEEHAGRVPWGCTMMARTALLRRTGGWPTEWVNNHFHHPLAQGCLNTCEDQALRTLLSDIGYSYRFSGAPTYVLDDQGHERLTDDVPVSVACPGQLVRSPNW